MDFSTFYRVSVPAVGRCEVLLGGEIIEEVKVIVFGKSVLQTIRDGRRDSCERQVCHRITCKGYEMKKCVHEDKERFMEQYSPVNIDVWIRDLDME